MKKVCPSRRRGATLVEAAFVLPVLLVILLGILEFGWYARNQLTVANATREGARAASIGRTQNEVRTRVINTARPIAVTSGEISLQYSTNSGGSYTNFPSDDTTRSPSQNGVPAGTLLRVSIDVPHRRLINLPITPARIITQVSMVRERS